jgi:protein-L-isoaspartate(D-aspartate) O-methyltransferase
MQIDKIVRQAPKEMQAMLASVFNYNSDFVLNKKQEGLLEKILFAMSVVDRKYFYPGVEAYDDTAMPIGGGQTISQPSTVARMLLLAGLEEGDDVLEVGSGSGWNASLLAFLVYPGSVVSVERLAELKEKAEDNLKQLKNCLEERKPEIYEKLGKIEFYAENIFERGKVWERKYDKIIITAGIEYSQEKKIEILARNLLEEKGVLVCPYVSGPLLVYKKEGELKKEETKESYVFVPLLE